MKTCKLFIFLSLIALHSTAKVSLPAVISSGMVLQQQSEVALWGKAKSSSKLSIVTSWNKKTYSLTTEKDGSWKTTVQTPTAGGPYGITFNDGEKLELQDVLIGEVWVCSGQSNMQMPVGGFMNEPVAHSLNLLMEAEEQGIRLFKIERTWANTPRTGLKARWKSSNAENISDFSAVGYQFARMLQKQLHVPVGIIESAFGGTPIEAWMKSNSLAGFTDYPVKTDTTTTNRNDASVLFNAMINPIVGFHIKGVIWYQGESNRSTANTYDRKMQAMVKEWRNIWACGDWPFYYVQIAPFLYKGDENKLPLMYEAQARAMRLIPNSGMAVSVDAGSEVSIHPSDKTVISQRLAYWALAKTYGKKGIPYQGPKYKSIQTENGKAIVNFEHANNGLTAYDKPLINFEIAGEDRVFYPGTAIISGSTVVVQSNRVSKPVAVRYAFKDWLAGNLYNVGGLPAAPFRTDQW